MKSWNSAVKSVARSIERSTCSSPSTSRRTFIPSSLLAKVRLHPLRIDLEPGEGVAREARRTSAVGQGSRQGGPFCLPRARCALVLAEQVDADVDLACRRNREHRACRVA